jgi:hypothetical protein
MIYFLEKKVPDIFRTVIVVVVVDVAEKDRILFLSVLSLIHCRLVQSICFSVQQERRKRREKQEYQPSSRRRAALVATLFFLIHLCRRLW